MRPTSLLLMLFLGATSFAKGLNLDSLKQHHASMPDDTSKITTSFQLARAMRYAPEAKPILIGAYQLAIELDDIKFRCFSANNLGVLYYYQSIYDSAVYYFDETAELAAIREDKKAQSAALNNSASILHAQGDYARAMDLQLKSLSIKEDMKDSIGIANSIGSIAGLFMEQNDNTNALIWIDRCVTVFENIGDSSRLAVVYGNRAKVLHQLDRTEEAIQVNEAALRILDIYSNDKEEAGIRAHMARILRQQGRVEDALEQINEAMLLNERNKFKADVGYCYQIRGSVYLQMGKISETISDCTEAKRIALETDALAKRKDACACLYKAFKQLGSHDQALINLEESTALADSIMNEEKVRELTRSEMQYRFDAERELERLREQQEDALAEAEIAKQRMQKWIGLAAVVMLVLIAAILYRSIRRKKRDNEIIQRALEQKEVLLKEIHHRVKNNLQVISSLLSLQSRDIKDDAALQAVNESRNRVKSMALIHQNLYKEDDLTGINVKDYIGKLSKSLVKNYKVNGGVVEVETDIQDLNLDVDTTIPLGLILNELITNSLKYAFKDGRDGQVVVRLNEQKDELLLSVQDNGVGYDENADHGEESTGFGMRMIKTFSKKLKADYSIRNENGTVVEMKIRNYRKAS